MRRKVLRLSGVADAAERMVSLGIVAALTGLLHKPDSLILQPATSALLQLCQNGGLTLLLLPHPPRLMPGFGAVCGCV